MEVLKTTSPRVSPSAPKDTPSKAVPSDSTSIALFMYPALAYGHHRHAFQHPSFKGRILPLGNELPGINREFPIQIQNRDIRVSTGLQRTLAYAQNSGGVLCHFFNKLRERQHPLFKKS